MFIFLILSCLSLEVHLDLSEVFYSSLNIVILFLTSLCLVTQPCPTLCDPMDCSPPGSCVHGNSHQTQVSKIAGGFFTSWATREAITISKFFFIFGYISIEMSGNVLFNYKHCLLYVVECWILFYCFKGCIILFSIMGTYLWINFIFLRLSFKPCYDKLSVDLI